MSYSRTKYTPTPYIPTEFGRRIARTRKLLLDAAEQLYEKRRRGITSKELAQACEQSADRENIDEALKGLLEDGSLIRLSSGVYAPPQAAGQINYPATKW